MSSTFTNSLVETSTADNLILHGYFAPAEGETALLHIHGFEGNFYENHFTHIQAATLAKQNFPFLTVNTRGNGKDTNFNTTDGQEKRIGAYYEVLSEAYLDIDAWIEFLLNKGYKNIILQGHSLGTHKVVRYLFEGTHKDKVSKLILLAPFDKTGYVEKKTNGKWPANLKIAEQKVSEGKGEEIIPENFEDTMTSYQSYISWYEGSDFSHVFDFYDKSYQFPILRKITTPTKIIIGTKDPYFHPSNPDNPQEAMDILLQNIPNAKGRLIEGAVHSFAPDEQIMADEVVKFIDSNA